jgi:hypothetical protein
MQTVLVMFNIRNTHQNIESATDCIGCTLNISVF